MPEDKKTYLDVDINVPITVPKSIRKLIKEYAAREGITMQKYIKDLVENQNKDKQ